MAEPFLLQLLEQDNMQQTAECNISGWLFTILHESLLTNAFNVYN